jgi:hypothetical protein
MLVYFHYLDKNPGWVQMALTMMITMRTTRLGSTSRLDPVVMTTPMELFSLFIRSQDFEMFLFM